VGAGPTNAVNFVNAVGGELDFSDTGGGGSTRGPLFLSELQKNVPDALSSMGLQTERLAWAGRCISLTRRNLGCRQSGP
jgi:hypothetical protein